MSGTCTCSTHKNLEIYYGLPVWIERILSYQVLLYDLVEVIVILLTVM